MKIIDRSISYSMQIIKMYRDLKRADSVSQILGKQLLRSGTSIGANIHEAQGAQSKADFIAKMSIAHKEARESIYWLILIQKENLLPSHQIQSLLNETTELIKTLTAILLSSKKNIASHS